MTRSEIIERLEKLEGPSREVDALVMCALAAPQGSKVEQSSINGAWCIYEPARHGRAGRDPFQLWEPMGWWRQDGWTVTASLDAAVTLVERKLPGSNRTIRKRYRTTNGMINGHVFDAQVSGGDVCTGPSEAIALLIALFRALQDEEAKP